MNSKEMLSPFGQAALRLDHDFTEFEELRGQLERLSLDSDSGTERARDILVKFTECGQRIATGVQDLAKALDESRTRAEAAATFVSERALEVQERKNQSDRLHERFQEIVETAGKLSDSINHLKKPADETLSDEDKERLIRELPQFDSALGQLIDETVRLRDDARDAKIKTIERNADSMSQSLSSARRKLGMFVMPSSNDLH